MNDMTTTHECSSSKKDMWPTVIRYDMFEGIWNMENDMEYCNVPIVYCPFCGVKL